MDVRWEDVDGERFLAHCYSKSSLRIIWPNKSSLLLHVIFLHSRRFFSLSSSLFFYPSIRFGLVCLLLQLGLIVTYTCTHIRGHAVIILTRRTIDSEYSAGNKCNTSISLWATERCARMLVCVCVKRTMRMENEEWIIESPMAHATHTA